MDVIMLMDRVERNLSMDKRTRQGKISSLNLDEASQNTMTKNPLKTHTDALKILFFLRGGPRPHWREGD